MSALNVYDGSPFMRRIIILLLFLVVVVGGSLAIVYRHHIWDYLHREKYSPEQEKLDQAEAERLLNAKQPKPALAIIDKYQQRFASDGEVPQKWVELFVKGSVATQSPERILWLYEQYPRAVEKNEDAALVVADVLIKIARTNDYVELREKWKGREGRPEIWFVLDADKQLIDGDRAAAIAFLNTKSFEGSKDIPRLIRLALLSVEENPRMSWEYLTEAYQKDPENPEVRSYRARLLEAVGKTPLALTEYLAAARLAPESIVMRDQLAEFYRRHGRYKLALKVWEDGLDNPLSDFVWLKSWFWTRMATPTEFKFDASKVPQGELKPLIEFLLSLKPDQFWDTEKFEAVTDGNRFLQGQQATFWLRLAQALKDGKDDKALELLQYNHFNPVSWNSELETLLKRVLTYRKSGTLVLDSSQTKDLAKAAADEQGVTPLADQRHPFFTELESLAAKQAADGKVEIPAELLALIKSNEAFSASFLATGWLQAALELNKDTILPEDMPDWFAYGLTQALRYNQGNLQALDFATKQKQTPALTLLIGELLISTDSPDAGLEKLLPLTKLQDDVGFRATWLAALLYVEREQFDKAKEMINSNPRLTQDVLGREALARISLLEGNADQADKLYSALEGESWEAKSYLARKAYSQQNWGRAKELTEVLLKEFPNNMLLRQNYEKILEEESKATGKPLPEGMLKATQQSGKAEQKQPVNASKPK